MSTSNVSSSLLAALQSPNAKIITKDYSQPILIPDLKPDEGGWGIPLVRVHAEGPNTYWVQSPVKGDAGGYFKANA